MSMDESRLQETLKAWSGELKDTLPSLERIRAVRQRPPIPSPRVPTPDEQPSINKPKTPGRKGSFLNLRSLFDRRPLP